MPQWKCGNCGYIVERDKKPATCPKCGFKSLGKKRLASWKRKQGRPQKPGRPAAFAEDKLRQIYELLPRDGTRVQAKELKEKAMKDAIGPNTLFNYLAVLEKNLHALKEVDATSRPPKVYYRRITEKEFFGIKETLTWAQKQLDQIRPFLEKLPKEITPPLKNSVLSVWLGVLTSYLAIIGSRASAIEDLQKRREFIDVTLRLHVYPTLLEWSSKDWVEPGLWKSALEPFSAVVYETSSSAVKECIQSLPAPLRPIFEKMGPKPSKNDVEKAQKIIKKLGGGEKS
jgi:DNA-directed RNA polymerase subunit RPC12/RpoP